MYTRLNRPVITTNDNSTSKHKIKFGLNDWIGLGFVAPTLIGLFVFSIYPMFASFIMSFQQTNGMSGTWNGLNNYIFILNDNVFWKSVYNTLYMGVIWVTLEVCFSFILASMINNVAWGKSFFKSVFFLPNIISTVAVTILFSFLLYPTEQGLINYVLKIFNIGPIGWFTNPRYSKISIVIMNIWGSVGYDSIIFLAGLQNVPKELYEAAEIDGASGLRKWWSITIPYLKPIFTFIIVIGTIGSMKRFSDVWLMGGTAGNPNGSLLTVVVYIYRNAFMASQVGLASAAAYVLFAFILILSIVNLKVFNKDDSSE